MGNDLRSAISRFLRTRWLIPGVLVTLLTLGIVGAVIATTTSAGCGTANKLGLKSSACVKTNAVAGVTAFPSAKGGSPAPVPTPAIPTGTPESTPLPPDVSPVTPGSPLGTGGSFSFPPIPNSTSGNGGPSLAVSCSLPIFAGAPGSGGFVTFPGASFIADPRSAVAAPSPGPGLPSPTPNQYGGNYPGWWGLTYDAAYKKWLPVPYNWVSPDGSHYAYALGTDIYVVDVSTGVQSELAPGRNFLVLSLDPAGVYAIPQSGQAGLWYLPYAGTPKEVITTGYWQGESHGFAFGTPTSAVPSGAPTTVERLDIKTGAITSWYTSQPGAGAVLIGFDLSGYPILEVSYPTGFAIWIAAGPSNLTGISWNYSGDAGLPQGRVIADSHGLWFGTNAGIDLYANGKWYLMANLGGQLAGPCV